ncbi:hypothetical protein ACGFY6_02885 [Streptomyces sp. NPDC048387]|uniref:hypothetical protein n=1 Tax=unclassified Streptomyces TaxID=2593676 RepID=UPI0033D4C88C
MAGVETAVLRAASTAAGWLWRSRLGQAPGARLTDRPGLDRLTITLGWSVHADGLDRIPPERIKRLSPW